MILLDITHIYHRPQPEYTPDFNGLKNPISHCHCWQKKGNISKHLKNKVHIPAWYELYVMGVTANKMLPY